MLHIKPYLPGDYISLDPNYLSVVVCMRSAIKRELKPQFRFHVYTHKLQLHDVWFTVKVHLMQGL